MIRIIIILFFGSVLFLACEEIRSYPPEPEITYINHSLRDTLDLLGNKIKNLHLEFKVADGDGDLANPDINDSLPRGRIFYTFYEKINGVYQLVPETRFADTLKPIFKIPYEIVMNREGQNKTLTGKILVDYPFYNYSFNPYPFDTFKVEFYVVDISYNKSNVATIPEELVLDR